MTVTEFHSEVQRWRTGEVIRLSWGYDGKVVRAVLLAKNGARYVPPSGISADDKELAESMLGDRCTVREAKAWLAVKDNQALIESVRKAKA